MPSTDRRDRLVLAAVAVVAILVVAYGLLVAQAGLAAIGIAVPLVALYLFWRFVRAHEQIADALE